MQEPQTPQNPPLTRYSEWMILRLLLTQGYFPTVFPPHGAPDPELLQAFAITPDILRRDDAQTHIQTLLNHRYAELSAENCLADPDGWQQAYANLAMLKNRLQLNACETALLRFAVHANSEDALGGLIRQIRANYRRVVTVLAALLGQDKSAIHQALKKDHKLKGYGILHHRDYGLDSVDDYIAWGDVLDVEELYLQPLNERTLLRHCLFPAETPAVAWEDFDHIAPMRELIAAHLGHALQNASHGVNILIHGAPGTGKSEFSALLGKHLNLPCYMLSFEDGNGDPLESYQRLNHCRLAQAVLAGDKALLVFDEAEDIFSGTMTEKSEAHSKKGWVNRFLENNALPMLWITNHVGAMDEAFIRRFDIVLEMPDLPVSQKSALLAKHSRLPAHDIRHFAHQENLAPALITRTLQVVANAQSADPGSAARQLFNQTLHAQGKRKIPPAPAPAPYDTAWIHTDADLLQIEQGLKTRPQARILCYGAPGTGKSAWAQHLADRLDMPLLLRHSADLLDSYVGETEKRIAQAFARAQEENRLLLLDEIDSFLFNRDGASHSWERTMVNEMLTQIEHYQGLLIVSTNALPAIDHAALRRFDVKIRFKPLSAPQITALARAQAQTLGLPEPAAADLEPLLRLKNLTPGDFAAVARRHRFAPFADCRAWVQALMDECRLKPGNGERMGF